MQDSAAMSEASVLFWAVTDGTSPLVCPELHPFKVVTAIAAISMTVFISLLILKPLSHLSDTILITVMWPAVLIIADIKGKKKK